MSLRTENNFTRAEKTHPPDPLERQIAYERVEAVKNDMMPSSGAPLLSILSYVYKTIYATCFDTMCVSLSADGLPCLGVGPLFTASLDDLNSVMFVLFHEAMHLMRRHLVKDDRAKRRDSRYQMAQEAWINYVMPPRGLKSVFPSRPVSIQRNYTMTPKKIWPSRVSLCSPRTTSST
jgi:hypothetical protein